MVCEENATIEVRPGRAEQRVAAQRVCVPRDEGGLDRQLREVGEGGEGLHRAAD